MNYSSIQKLFRVPLKPFEQLSIGEGEGSQLKTLLSLLKYGLNSAELTVTASLHANF